MDYENMGIFDQISGLLFARPYGMKTSDQVALWEVLKQRTEPFSFPVVGNLDIGHTSPLITLPIGCSARMDSGSQRIILVESAVDPK